MSALSFARQVFNPEKPHSSITDWVDILTASSIAEEAYDGIPELVDSINLQGSTGPAEASRALRKKLKHGNAHQQYRSLVILKALVENCGDKFRHTFADGQLTDALRQIATDRSADKRVQKKLKLVLLSWHEQFKSEPSMRTVSDLYLMFKEKRYSSEDPMGVMDPAALQARAEKEAKRKAKQEKEERARQEEEERKRQKQRAKTKRQPFNFEQEKPKVLGSIVEGSQASSNLVNAITLVNPEKESLQSNSRVQECLGQAKQVRKHIVRYIQLVENEEIIGVLIETNDRIITALEMYDQMSAAPKTDQEKAAAAAEGLAATHISPESELARLQGKQRAEVEKAKQNSIRGPSTDSSLHPDLQDLNFGSLGASSSNLAPPIRPTTMSDDGKDDVRGGSLSDFSDYESSDEETHKSSQSRKKEYITVSDDSDDATTGIRRITTHDKEEDPFADPFVDEAAIGPPKRW
ncbi:vhs domain protein [Moniliophthora roreri MCA 2997]|uniref:Vhs domain protein n=2 Tax=Moniliophthora roreri TaxID=221103 RepID=V2XYY2_MONRO|nr:vhs domain protein [Moniliophthora roreri MCA 2997]